jgi:hypothetical protein
MSGLSPQCSSKQASGTSALDEIASWQRKAGLMPMKPIQFTSLPGWVSLPAAKRQ